MSRERLTEEGLREGMVGLTGWTVAEGLLTKTFQFDSYMSGIAFVNQAAETAESMDHHPDLLVTYRKVKVSVSTHDAGGITEFDLEFAKRLEGCVGS